MKVAPRRLRQPSYCSGKQVQVPRSALADEGGGDASTLKRCVRRRARAPSAPPHASLSRSGRCNSRRLHARAVRQNPSRHRKGAAPRASFHGPGWCWQRCPPQVCNMQHCGTLAGACSPSDAHAHALPRACHLSGQATLQASGDRVAHCRASPERARRARQSTRVQACGRLRVRARRGSVMRSGRGARVPGEGLQPAQLAAQGRGARRLQRGAARRGPPRAAAARRAAWPRRSRPAELRSAGGRARRLMHGQPRPTRRALPCCAAGL